MLNSNEKASPANKTSEQNLGFMLAYRGNMEIHYNIRVYSDDRNALANSLMMRKSTGSGLKGITPLLGSCLIMFTLPGSNTPVFIPQLV